MEMKKYSLPYGTTNQSFSLPDDWDITILKPQKGKALENPRDSVVGALSGLGSGYSSLPNRRTVAVSINDKTRPVPHSVLLPPLVQWLEEQGYQRNDVTFIVATGAHDPVPEEEFHKIVPTEIESGWKIVSHDAWDTGNLINLGTTSAGNICRINKTFAEADLKIVVGNIEPHQFMGWSGGVKSASIGLAGEETISGNHSMLSRDGAGPCRFDDNPVRQDVEEMGRMIGVDIALNVVLNDEKEIIDVFAGSPISVMKRGIESARNLFSVFVEKPADLVITSPGGYPKDINLYQAQKALRHGSTAAKKGAPVILAAACSEGVGSQSYQNWIVGKKSHTEVRESFHQEAFRIGPHKAMLFAGDAESREVFLVSELPAATVRELLLEHAASIQEIIDELESRWATGNEGAREEPVRVSVIPYGNTTVAITTG